MIVADYRLINVPNTYLYLMNVPETCKCFNNKKAADVIKLRILSCRDPVLGVVPKCNHMYPFKMEVLLSTKEGRAK